MTGWQWLLVGLGATLAVYAALLVGPVVPSVLRSGGPELVREHWRGPQRSLDALLRLA